MLQKKYLSLVSSYYLDIARKIKSRVFIAVMATLLALSVLSGITISTASTQNTNETEDSFSIEIENVNSNRLYGKIDQYTTSLFIAQEIIDNNRHDGVKVASIVLVSDINHLHALMANRFAASINAPIVLVSPQGLTSQIIDLISSNQLTSVYIVGSSGFISDDVLEKIYSIEKVNTVERIAAFENNIPKMSVSLAERAGNIGSWCDKEATSKKAVFVVADNAAVDAVMIVSHSVAFNIPILATHGQTLSSDIRSYLIDNNISTAVIIGDADVVANEIEEELSESGLKSIIRLGGLDRYSTSVAVLDALNECPEGEQQSSRYLALVNGRNFSDALSSGALLANGLNEEGWIPLLVTPKNILAESLHWRLQQPIWACPSIIAFGSQNVLSQYVVDLATTLVERCEDISSLWPEPPLIPLPPVPGVIPEIEPEVIGGKLVSLSGNIEPEAEPELEEPLPPEIVGIANVNFNEGDTFPVATYSRFGAVLNNDFTWSLTGPDAAAFTLNSNPQSNMVQIAFINTPDYESSTDIDKDNVYEVVLTITDEVTPPLSNNLLLNISVNNIDEAGSVAISPTISPRVGTELSAVLSDPDGGIRNQMWQWQTNGGGELYTNILGATSSIYMPRDTDMGNMLLIISGYSDAQGKNKTAMSTTITIVQEQSSPQNSAPVITNNKVAHERYENHSGEIWKYEAVDSEDQMLSWSLSGPDADLFYLSDTGYFGLMKSVNYEVPEDSNTDNIYDVIIAVTDNGTPVATNMISVETQILNQDEPGQISTISSGSPQEGTMIRAILEDRDGVPKNINWRWESSSDGETYIRIANEKSATYTIKNIPTGSFVRVVAIYDDPQGIGKMAVGSPVGPALATSSDTERPVLLDPCGENTVLIECFDLPA